MAETTIPVIGSGGQQAPATDATLQAGTEGGLNNNLTGNVQPVVTGDQLTTTEGVSLVAPTLPAISLGSPSNTAAQPVKVNDDFNPILLVFGVGLIILAIVSYKIISDSGKKHN